MQQGEMFYSTPSYLCYSIIRKGGELPQNWGKKILPLNRQHQRAGLHKWESWRRGLLKLPVISSGIICMPDESHINLSTPWQIFIISKLGGGENGHCIYFFLEQKRRHSTSKRKGTLFSLVNIHLSGRLFKTWVMLVKDCQVKAGEGV